MKSYGIIRRHLSLALLAWVCAGTISRAEAETVAAGEQIAQTWCRNCHQVGPKVVGVGSDAVPSFVSIARMPSTTQMSLTVFLSTNHAHMPDYSLTREEIRNVTAYILSLRNPQK